MQLIKCDKCGKEMNPVDTVLIPINKLMSDSRSNLELCNDCATRQIKFDTELNDYTRIIEQNINVLMDSKVQELEKKYFSKGVTQ